MSTNTARFSITIDMGALRESVSEAIREAVEGNDPSGVGNNGDSDFEINEVEVTADGDTFDVAVKLTRLSGLMVSNDDLTEALTESIDLSFDITLEGSIA